MKHLRVELVVSLVALVAAPAFGPACSRAPVPQGYETLGPDIEPFRTAFNAATGKVRAVLLVGPT